MADIVWRAIHIDMHKMHVQCGTMTNAAGTVVTEAARQNEGSEGEERC